MARPKFSWVIALWALYPAVHAARAQTPTALSLGDAVRLAVSQSAVTQTARLRTNEAEARIRQRRADLLPNISASVQRLGRQFNTATLGFEFKGPTGQPFFNPRGEVIGPVNSVELHARVSQSLFDAAAWQRVRAADFAAKASSVDEETAGEQAATTAALAYVRALRGEAQVGARLADSVLAEDLVAIANDQLRAGTGIALDVTRARAQAASVHAQLIAARNERDRARLELLRALSLPANVPLSLTDSLGDLPTEAPAGGSADAKARPELRALEAQLRTSDQQIRAARMERLPSASAFIDHGPVQGSGGAYLPVYSFGIQLSVPVFDGFRREGRIEEQAAQRRALEVRRHDLDQQIAIDIQSAELDLASAREQVAAARGRLALADQEVTQARDRFRAGVAGNADVVTASLSINSARTLYVDALTAYQNARIAVARARGQAAQLR